MTLKEFEIPQIGPEEFLLKVEMVGICGGDPIEYEGRNPKTHYPLILGHEVVGHIAEIGDKAAKQYGVEVGDRVTVEPYVICGKCYSALTVCTSSAKTAGYMELMCPAVSLHTFGEHMDNICMAHQDPRSIK
jgi:alcohol dehydrogenase